MNGNKLLLDTILKGDKTLADILEGKQVYMSFITELELYSYKYRNKEIAVNAYTSSNSKRIIN